VQPIFNNICVKCHGGDETKEGLVLKSYADVMAGSDNGPVITPGDVANSFLIEQVVNGKMPKKGPRLLPAQIRTLSDWVAAGAPNN
jgi:mono/diheme cytochrome c family protein